MSYPVPVLKGVYQLSPTMLSHQVLPQYHATHFHTLPQYHATHYHTLPQYHAIHYQALPAPVVTVEKVVQEPKTVKTTVETTVVTTEVKEIKVPEIRSTCLWRHEPVNFFDLQ